MERRIEINLSLAICLSVAAHAFLFVVWIIPASTGLTLRSPSGSGTGAGHGGLAARDIVVNINEDNIAKRTVATYLSDKDSSGRGYITKEKGDTYIDNANDFKYGKAGRIGSSGRGTRTSSSSSRIDTSRIPGMSKLTTAPDTEEYPISIELIHDNPFSAPSGGYAVVESEWTRIPSVRGMNPQNSLFISNSGTFSFNTAKFKNFEYFKRMKNKIADNWATPDLGRAILPRAVDSRGYTAPGYTRTSLIPSQEVYLYFTMNRSGEVLDVTVLSGNRNSALVQTCVEAVRNSKNFGNVPADMKGPLINIPFVFGYYVEN